MPTLVIEGHGSCEVPEGQRLVQAIEDCGVDIGHRCGGHARCTTCRVRFLSGEPSEMTRAEHDKLKAQNHLGAFRLSCQLVANRPMHVEVLMRQSDMGWSDPGPTVDPDVQPEATWHSRDELAAA